MIIYSQSIIWQGQEFICTGDEGESLYEVKQAVVELAVKSGWKPRRGWEFWRWNESYYYSLKPYYDNYMEARSNGTSTA